MNIFKKRSVPIIGSLIIMDLVGFITLPTMNNYSNVSQDDIGIDSSRVAFVCHYNSSFITVIDLMTNKIIDTIHIGKGAAYFTLSKDRKNAFVVNFQSNDITIINTYDINNRESIALGQNPICVCLTADEQEALISHQSPDGLWFMDTKTHQITKKISDEIGLMCLSKKDNKIYQAAFFKSQVDVIDPVKHIILKSIYVGGNPLNLDITPDGKYLYVSNSGLKEIEVIDTKADSLVNRISLLDIPKGVSITPDSKYILIANICSNLVTVIETKNNSIVKKIPVGKMPTEIAITKDGKYAYVINQESAYISVISIDKLEVINTIKIKDNPSSIFLYD